MNWVHARDSAATVSGHVYVICWYGIFVSSDYWHWDFATNFWNGMELWQGAEFDQLGEEDLDALFEEYGETVRNDEESNSITSEVDEDSDSLACESRKILLEFLPVICCLSFSSCSIEQFGSPFSLI